MIPATNYNYNETMSPQAQPPVRGLYRAPAYYRSVIVPQNYNEATSPVGRLCRVSNYSFQVRVATSHHETVSPQPQVNTLYRVPAYYLGNPSPQSRAQFVHQVASPIIMAGSPNASGTVFSTTISGLSPIPSPQVPQWIAFTAPPAQPAQSVNRALNFENA